MRRKSRWGDRVRGEASVVALAACLAAAGCLPPARINAACGWTDDVRSLSPPGEPRRRAHLIEDVRVAKDLGIRYADAFAGRMNTPAWGRAQAWCTARSLAEIVRAHQVSRAELADVARARELWIDLLAVFLPMTVLLLIAWRAVVTRVVRDYDPTDRAVTAGVLATLAPLGAGVALVLTQVWGTLVEQLRLRDEHISYRAFELPASRHGWLLWAIALALFAGLGAVELLRSREPASRRDRVTR